MKLIKSTAVLFVLTAFLLPSTGFVFYLHQCRSMSTVELSLDGSNSCCTAPSGIPGNIQNHTDTGNCSHQTSVSKQTCCEDSRLFVKIDSDYLASFSKVFQSYISLIIRLNDSGPSPVLHAHLLPGERTNSPDPPWQDILLVTSSLRL